MGKVTGKEVGWTSLGPLGRSRGSMKTYKADGPILQITLHLRENDSGRVRSAIPYLISFRSESRNGTVIGSSEHFGSPQQKGLDTMTKLLFRIDTSVEQLQSISVLGKEFAYLKFHTNRNDYGPYGYTYDYLNDCHSWNYTEKNRVSLEKKGEIIAGFYGYEDSNGQLSGLGVYVVPTEGLHIQDPDCEQHQKTKIEELKTKIEELKTKIEELKTKIKESEAKNEVLKKRNKEIGKEAKLAKPSSALAESSKGKVDIAECIKALNAMKDLDGASYMKLVKLLKDDPSWRPIFLCMPKQRVKDFIARV